MSDAEWKFPSWQIPLQEAVVEVDPAILERKVQKVETLIFERLQAISSESDHQEERQALADAAGILRVLKKGRLSYPDWNTPQE